MSSLTAEDIKMFSKSVLLKSFHKYLRLWFISGKLGGMIANDPEIKPFITPCNGHFNECPLTTSNYDVIDGVLTMEAYCYKCQSNKTGTQYSVSSDD